MNDLGMRGKGVEPAGDPVIETGPHGDQQIGIGHRHVGVIGAMHAEHPHGQWIGAGKSAQPHQGHGDRNGQRMGEFGQFLIGVGRDDPAAGVNHRFFGFENRLAGLLDLAGMRFIGRPIGPHLDRLRFRESVKVLTTIFLGRSTSTGPGRPVRAI